MARFYGKIGYAVTEETTPGVWTEKITERDYYGDVKRNTRRWENSEHLNDDVNVNNIFSIMADPYAYENFSAMRYVVWMGTAWKITSIEEQRPRLILNVGGVYNGQRPTTETT